MDKPTVKRKEREKEARREAILDAAARIFSRKSFYEATLDEIAADAELAKGTLYNYFKDKQDIFASLMARGHQQARQTMDEAIELGGNLQELLSRLFRAWLQTLIDNKYMFRMILTAGAHLSESFRSEMMKQWRDQADMAVRRLADVFAVMPETRQLPESDRLTGAHLILASITAIHHEYMVEEADWGRIQQDIENHTRLLCRALTVEHTG